MKELLINTSVQVYAYDELPAEYKELVDIARDMTRNAYNPYSHFAVGAAIRMANGQIVRGSNQENAAYPSGLCAERTAMFAASANYPGVAMKQLAVAAFTDGHFTGEPGSPCGACRQVMVEYEDKQKEPMVVLLYGEKYTYVFRSSLDLLPLYFVGESLKGL